jgi:hypothetical protein
MAMRSDTGIETVTVLRKDLRNTLKDNLKTHKEVFAEAMKGYEDAKVSKMLALSGATSQATRENIQSNRKAVHAAYQAYSNLAKPVDNSESYELAIEIMKWETEEKIELNINDFQCYVRDRWNWKAAFKGSVSAYANDHSHRI